MPEKPTAPPAPPAEQRRAPSAMRRSAIFAPSTFDADQRTIEMVWSTGAAVQRMDWWSGERWQEELSLDAGAVDLTRLNAGAPLLNAHSSNDLSDQIGVVERAWVENGEGRALVRFSSRDDVAPILADVRAGIIRNVSVGYSVERWQDVAGGTTQMPIRRAVAWTPMEISLVPVPADPGAQTRGAQAVPPASPSPTTSGQTPPNPEVRMPDENTPAVPAQQNNQQNTQQPPAAPVVPDPTEAVRAAAQVETLRIRSITTAARALGLEERGQALIDEGVDLATAQGRLIAELEQSQRAAGGTPRPAAISVTQDEGDTARRALSDAIMHRAGVLTGADGRPAALSDQARQYRGFQLRDYAAECIRLRGGNTRGMAPVEIAMAALGNRDHMARAGIGMHSTSDFPNLLANTANKALGQGYGSARRTFTAWARSRTLPDFKSFRVINLSGAPKLAQIAEGGEISYGAIGEGAESYNLLRYGRRVAITFEAIVNDDMSGFTRVPQMFGNSSARLESEMVYSILNANPAMADGTALFDAAHANVFGGSGAGVLNVAGLSAGRALMRKQTSPARPNGEAGDVLDLEPTYLLVPAELEGAALQYTSMAYVPATQGNINPFANSLTPLVEPRLTSATQWYLIASNLAVDTVEYGYLEGMEAPQITSYVDEDTDGVIVKCTHSFGAKATDFRGMARATGA